MAREHDHERRPEPATPTPEASPHVDVQAVAQAAGPVPAPAAAPAAGGRARTASEEAYEKPEIDPTAQAMGDAMVKRMNQANGLDGGQYLSLIHISEPTRLLSISYAVFCLK